MEDRDLMKKIQALSFAKIETELYLDTHPDNKNALEYYRELVGELDMLMTKYQNEVGPIFAEGVVGDRWHWVDGKWPWQNDAEGKREEK